MSQQLPNSFPRAGHTREPGPDPRPTPRRSTEPQKDFAAKPVGQVSKPIRRKKGKRCGSQKARHELSKAIASLLFQKGIFELEEERAEATQTAAVQEVQSELTFQERVFSDLNITSTGGQAADCEERFIVIRFAVMADGREEAVYYDRLSHREVSESDLPSVQTVDLESLGAREKIKAALRELDGMRIQFKLSDLVKQALENPQISKLLAKYQPPSSTASTTKRERSKPLQVSHSGGKKKLH